MTILRKSGFLYLNALRDSSSLKLFLMQYARKRYQSLSTHENWLSKTSRGWALISFAICSGSPKSWLNPCRRRSSGFLNGVAIIWSWESTSCLWFSATGSWIIDLLMKGLSGNILTYLIFGFLKINYSKRVIVVDLLQIHFCQRFSIIQQTCKLFLKTYWFSMNIIKTYGIYPLSSILWIQRSYLTNR